MNRMLLVIIGLFIMLSSCLYVFNFNFAPKVIAYSDGISKQDQRLSELTSSEFSDITKLGIQKVEWNIDGKLVKGFAEYRIDTVKMLSINILIVLIFAIISGFVLIKTTNSFNPSTIVPCIVAIAFLLIYTSNVLITAYSDKQFQEIALLRIGEVEESIWEVEESIESVDYDEIDSIVDSAVEDIYIPDISTMEEQISDIYDAVFY